jgi:phospholipase C
MNHLRSSRSPAAAISSAFAFLSSLSRPPVVDVVFLRQHSQFIQHNFGIPEGALNFADARASYDLTAFFQLAQPPHRYRTINAPKNANFFLHDKRKATDPDDQ